MLDTNDVAGIKVIMPNVILLAYTPGGKVITVSRRGKYNEAGLPGGKVEFGENGFQALEREIREELNIVLDITQLEPIYKAREDGVETTTYRYNKTIDITDLPIVNSENCYVTAMKLEHLGDSSISPFWEYNTGLIKHIESGETFQWVN